MVLIFSRVQRCNVPGAPNGFYKFGEQFDASPELAKQLIEANVCRYVEKGKPTAAEPPRSAEEIYKKKQGGSPDVEAMPPETPEVIPEPSPEPEPQKPAKKSRR